MKKSFFRIFKKLLKRGIWYSRNAGSVPDAPPHPAGRDGGSAAACRLRGLRHRIKFGPKLLLPRLDFPLNRQIVFAQMNGDRHIIVFILLFRQRRDPFLSSPGGQVQENKKRPTAQAMRRMLSAVPLIFAGTPGAPPVGQTALNRLL